MTDCPNGEIRDLLPDLLHDRLAPAVRRDVEAHVRACDDCQQELALLRAMRSSLRRAPSVDIAAIAAAIPAYRAPARRSRGGWRAAAAIVILAAGGTSVAVLQRTPAVRVDSMIVAAPSIAQRAPDSSAEPVSAPLQSGAPSATTAPRELALGSSVVGDLNDGELSALLKDLKTVDVLPSPDVDNAASVSPMSPTGTE